MSIVFKPTISTTFEHIKPVVPVAPVVVEVKPPEPVQVTELPKVFEGERNHSAWTSHEIKLLINMRALRLTYKECGQHLNRSTNSCGSAIHTYNLYDVIIDKQKELVDEVLNG